jgi:hypothetical protein
MTTISWPQAAAWRLAQHGLLERAPQGALLPLVTRIVALHAQVLSSAELAAWQRVEGLGPNDVRDAIWQDRTLVKTWAMRGTLHLVPATELPLVAAAAHTRTSWRSAPVLKYAGLTLDEMEAIITGTRDALDGQCLTREELADAVAEKTGKPELREKMRSGWGSLLKPAAYHGYLCFGPNRGTNVTFVRPDQWIGGWLEHDPQDALLEVARRYWRTFGPATRDDFARWWGVEVKDIRPTYERLLPELEEVSVAGKKAWALRETVEAIEAMPDARLIRLLPGFDPYVVSVNATHRPQIMLPAFHDKISRKGAWISPVVLVDGRTAGVWQHEVKKGRLLVRVEPFEAFTPEIEQGIEAEAQRLGAFLGAAAEVTYGVVFPGSGTVTSESDDA